MTEIDSPGVVSPSAPPALEPTDAIMPAVAVYPALLQGPGGDDGPPPYTTLPYSASGADANPWVAVCPGLPSPRHHGGHAPAGVRLGYVDFVPRVRRKKLFSRDDYETFDTLILRANSWLEENPGYNVVACQTVTWMGRRFKDIYADSCAAERSMHAAKSTKFLIGLRLWYHVEGVGCPSGQPSSTAPALVCRTFLPKADERFDQLVHRVNKRLESDRLGGRIVSVEVVRLLCSSQKQYRPQILNPNLSLWKEHADCTKKFVHCVRVYALLTVHQDGYETIGYQDFVPEYNRRNKDNKGYELFSDVMQRASRWIASQQSVRFTNVETINVKIKRNTTFEERCVYSEHRCANHRLNYLTGPNRTTRYIRVVRAFFVVTKGAGGRMDYPSARLTVRTFSPLQLTRPTPGHPAEFEQTRHLVDRVNQWLQVTGASVFSVETVCIKATRCQVQLLGSEATYSENSMTGAWAERWLYHIRLYLDGEYVEPPPALDLVQPAAQV